MPVLHVVSRSPHEAQALAQCLARVGEGDAVLLSENGVYAALRDSLGCESIRGALARLRVYVLTSDLEARGISPGEVLKGVEAVDYEGFVDLAVRYSLCQSWF